MRTAKKVPSLAAAALLVAAAASVLLAAPALAEVEEGTPLATEEKAGDNAPRSNVVSAGEAVLRELSDAEKNEVRGTVERG